MTAFLNARGVRFSATDLLKNYLFSIISSRETHETELMACHAGFHQENRGGFTRILKAVAVVSFRYNIICNLPTHEQERVYNSITRGLCNGTLSRPTDVINALQSIFPHLLPHSDANTPGFLTL
ncbi:hypothetical protein [Desulfoplanes sp.]